MEFKVLSYNIHKGFSSLRFRNTLKDIKKSIDIIHPDIVCLQEVHGDHNERGDQLEVLADTVWPNSAYGKNAVYPSGHHGNAILSKTPIAKWENEDLTSHFIERRGLLYAKTYFHESKPPVHIMSTHLGLLATWRKDQLKKIIQYVRTHIPENEPLLLCGDFNDWNHESSDPLFKELGLKEAFAELTGQCARTFPSRLPLLPLDRIYFRNLHLNEAKILSDPMWCKLSDHLPLWAHFSL